MPTYAKEGEPRCFDYSQDLNWHGSHKKLWKEFKAKFTRYKDIPNRQLKETMDDFFKYCAKVLIETPHGIVLKRIGYISMTVFDKPKKAIIFNKQLILNHKSEDIYRAYFFPVRGLHSVFKGWMFSIHSRLRKRIKEQIQGGMRYYNHIKFLDKNSKVI